MVFPRPADVTRPPDAVPRPAPSIHKIEHFNYLNVAFISYKLTMWDSLLFSDGHKASWPTSKDKRHLYWAVASSCCLVITSDQSPYFLVEIF